MNGDMDSETDSGAPLRVFELRQYELVPGSGDAFVELFDRELVETQESYGLRVIGQFRLVGHPDRFVWWRGFPDMESRRLGLAAFYGGPVWASHGPAANALMVDSDNVLLLRAVTPDPPDFAPGAEPDSGVVVTVYPLAQPAQDAALDLFLRRIEPRLVAAGASLVGLFVTDPSPNSFPGLPVREGEHVLVRVSRFADSAALAAHEERLDAASDWAAAVGELADLLSGPPGVLVLGPTPRSRFR